MKTAPSAVALLCAAALAAAGCGGDDEDSESFRKDYNAVARKYASLPGEVSAAVRGAGDKSARDLERQFARLARRLTAEVRALRRLEPPSDAADEFRAFVNGLADVRDDLRRISSGAAENSSRRVGDAARKLVEDSNAVSRAEDRLKKAVD